MELLQTDLHGSRDKIQSKEESIRELKLKVSQLEAIQDNMEICNANLLVEKEELTGQLYTVTMDLSKQKEEKQCFELKFQGLEIIQAQLTSEIASKDNSLERLDSNYDKNEKKLKTVEAKLAKACLQLQDLSNVQLPEKAFLVEALENLQADNELTGKTENQFLLDELTCLRENSRSDRIGAEKDQITNELVSLQEAAGSRTRDLQDQIVNNQSSAIGGELIFLKVE